MRMWKSLVVLCATTAGLLWCGAVSRADTFVAPAEATAQVQQQEQSAESTSGFTAPPFTLSDPKLMADGVPRRPAANAAGEPYRGGRGLITLQGMSGMFLNPTSGTLNQGQLTAQYCLYIDRFDLNNVVGHGLMVSYGVTDWLELGGFGTVAEINGVDRRIFDDPIAVGGPIARVRLLKQEGWMPELSVGGMYVDGSSKGDLLYRAEGFVAASELMPLDTFGTFRSLRFHEGVRYVGRSERPKGIPKQLLGGGDFCLVYGGVELELPYNLYLIGELSSNNLLQKGGVHTPWSAGVQWKPSGVLGISVAYMTPEFLGLRQGFWFGIGLNFKV
jgi:hypothetical protein